MKKIYLVLLLLTFSIGAVQAANFRGFLLTKDNYRLTGYINKIEYSLSGIVIQFTNDFGDQYNIFPNLVNGFGFTSEDGEVHRYVSRFHEGRWLFLEAVNNGRRLRLFQAPTGSKEFVDDSFQAYLADPIPQYWLQLPGRKIEPVQRGGFKRYMRELLSEGSPSLAVKIGKKGYRYRDLINIVQEYNETAKRSRRRL